MVDPSRKKYDQKVSQQPLWERIAVFAFGVVFVAAILALAVFVPYPTTYQYTVFRIVLALAAAGVAALIPGFLEVSLRTKVSTAIKAGGAIAVFVIVFFFSPAALVTNPPEEQLNRLWKLHEEGRIAETILDEKAFWIQKGIGDEVIVQQECLQAKKCDDSKLLALVSDRVLSDPSQALRFARISEFYLRVALQAAHGMIPLRRACACFGKEVEIWQSSYYYLLGRLTKINMTVENGKVVDYQATLNQFAYELCDDEKKTSGCLT
ncbi:hypothetical protein HFO39_23670 [Rhizobium leguminosarum]|uniref:hypothetical protein n=1 Tax=Rhizobium leguminosarum TaxID=384 RepID=UPI001C96233E|nr:hypothetical protein [Rhizobium leguminosarum]MBY5637730.1 hypothetical protein [Rhizobium leguminosarum]